MTVNATKRVEMVRLYSEGVPVSKIAKMYKVSQSTIYNYINRYPVTREKSVPIKDKQVGKDSLSEKKILVVTSEGKTVSIILRYKGYSLNLSLPIDSLKP